MNTAIFITVRSDSTRLPGKAFLKILGKPVIEHIIMRTKLVTEVDEIVLCTTARSVDDELVAIADRLGIKYFRGSLEDKLERWLGAAKEFKIDYFVTMDGDDLFCDPELMGIAARQMENEGCDFIKAPKGLICGAFTYCIRTKALERVCEMKGTSDTEMMWVYFEDTGMFKVSELNVKEDVFFSDKIRMTLDYQEDFDFFAKIMEDLKGNDNDRPLREIVAYLRKNPAVSEMNAFRQAEFLANQKRKTKLILKR